MSASLPHIKFYAILPHNEPQLPPPGVVVHDDLSQTCPPKFSDLVGVKTLSNNPEFVPGIPYRIHKDLLLELDIVGAVAP